MKHAVLTSIGHNIADSLASGICLMVGVYDIDIFGEAAASSAGFIEVDFLTGTSQGGVPSHILASTIQRYAEALPDLCKKHRAEKADFTKLSARYLGMGRNAQFVVEITDRNGKNSVRRYFGSPGANPIMLDPLGRRRSVRSS